jgi:hypothetical protein
MTDFAYGNTIFCDDIRYEIGSKASLMGCFGAELRAFGETPVMLSSFSAYVSVRVPQSIEFRNLKIVIVADFKDGQKEVARAEFPLDPTQVRIVDPGQIFSVDVPFRFAQFIIEGDGFIRSRAYLDDLEVKLGSLRVVVLGLEEMPAEFGTLNPAKS